MALRHPPKEIIPPAAGKKPRAPRVVRFEQPPESFWRRWRRRLIRPATVVPVVVLTAVTVGVLGYYYHVFSERIDRLLRGEVFTRSAGIYAAPKQIRAGAGLSIDDVINQLKRAGYVEKSQQADTARGRYAVDGASLEVEPSKDSTIDGRAQFPHVRVQFGRGGKTVTSINDIDGGGPYYMLDGVEEWIRESMRLRGLSERALRQEQLRSGWTNDQLVEHLRGDHDGTDTHDEEILDRLRYNNLDSEAPKFIPEQVLRQLIGSS